MHTCLEPFVILTSATGDALGESLNHYDIRLSKANRQLCRIYLTALGTEYRRWRADAANGNCPELEACTDAITVDVNPGESSGESSVLNRHENLDLICKIELGNFTSCLKDKLASCDDNTKKLMMKINKDVLEYTCSVEGRKDLDKWENSPCANTTFVVDEMNARVKKCQKKLNMLNEELPLEALCGFIDKLKKCISAEIVDVCGVDSASYQTKIWNITLTNQFSQFDCAENAEQNHRHVKRALTTLTKELPIVSKLRRRK
ncbi:Ag precursor [Plakobranchus ocellatus]|uniref:Ag n=1 Tax=Plakobranchus ocellatus TaxID=259542 RepID=A0AAV3Z059_9GAST|nr:Ag precursor [Plakobranchus ocellatus]